MSRKSLARQAANNRAAAYTPTSTRRANFAETRYERMERKQAELVALLGPEPNTPNYFETLPLKDPTQRDIRHLADTSASACRPEHRVTINLDRRRDVGHPPPPTS